MNENEFREMFLLFEELIRKEIQHYCDCNKDLVNAYDIAPHYANRKVGQTLKIIFGKEKSLLFLSEVKKRRDCE